MILIDFAVFLNLFNTFFSESEQHKVNLTRSFVKGERSLKKSDVKLGNGWF